MVYGEESAEHSAAAAQLGRAVSRLVELRFAESRTLTCGAVII